MNEEGLIDFLEDMLKGLKEDSTNSHSAPLFKKVIANNVPIWSTVEQTPSVCFYLSETQYDEPTGLTTSGTSTVLMYVYNKHKARGLSLPDLLTTYVDSIKAEVKQFSNTENSILNAYVSRVKRDGGTVLPYTVAELTIDIAFIESNTCY